MAETEGMSEHDLRPMALRLWPAVRRIGRPFGTFSLLQADHWPCPQEPQDFMLGI
jgi:hypothetical protein